MKIIETWRQKLESPEASDLYSEYLEQEKDVYTQLLSDKIDNLKGNIADLSEKYKMQDWVFAGFMDGINTSLVEQVDVDELTSESVIDIHIDFEKLYYNMIDVKATWLYGLEEWDNIFSKDERLAIKKRHTKDHTAVRNKPGRNDPCTCGSNKKYKKCCGA